jgi:NAD(P)-dependent dehydrogenase (short-subunit alcohol dehydrogenase family)
VDRANASGLTPVMLVHGLFLLPSSWERWAELFEAAGYVALTPGWPDDPDSVADAKAHPEVLAGKSVPGVTEMVEMPGHGHARIIDSRWHEVAGTALAFGRQARDAGLTQGGFMDLNLAGKVAVVTGAGKGIGMATTLALADEGAQVVAGSLTVDTLDGLKGVTPVAVDLTASDGPAQLIRRAVEEYGRIDVLVNNVGAVRMRTEGFFGTSDEDFAWAMQMNFFIALRASRAALAEMVKNGSGAIVNVASVNAFFQPDAATIDYGAAKAALVNLTKTLAQEFGPHGIRVNAVSPGPVATDLWLGEHGVAATVAKATGVDTDTARQTIIAGIGGFATGRFTTPEEVATLITFLASGRAANITGANYLIDGGLIKTT